MEEFQHFATFHPKDFNHFASCSKNRIYFFQLKENEINSSSLDLLSLYDEKTCKRAGFFTQVDFSSSSCLAYTSTTKGCIIVWGPPMHMKIKIDQLMLEPTKRSCLRILQLFSSQCPIPFLRSLDNFIFVGTQQGKVCVFDENFKLQWSFDVNEGPICSLSFNFKPRLSFKQAVFKALGKDLRGCPDEQNDFIVCTSTGFVGYIKPKSSKLSGVLFGTSSLLKTIALHPEKSYLYIADSKGGLLKMNYESKKILNREQFEGPCNEIECMCIDSAGNYVACGLCNGGIVIFDAVSFSSKPCFSANDSGYRPVSIQFSPDPQHLIVIDEASYVHRYQLHLLMPSAIFKMLNQDKTLPEEPFWVFNGRTRQHRGSILDCMFNDPKKGGSVHLLTLGEDRFVVQYNISSSRSKEIVVIKQMNLKLDQDALPVCLCWFPLYGLLQTIGVVCQDNRIRIYNLEEEEEMIKIISLPPYEESLERILFVKNSESSADFFLHNKSQHDYFIFSTAHMLGLTKYPMDGNPNSSLALLSHPCGVHSFKPTKDQNFLFSTGLKSSWTYMYEIDILTVLEAEKEGGQGIDAFVSLFPKNEDPMELKRRILLSVYSLELEMKMLKFSAVEDPTLKGEIPVEFLHYVMSVLGYFPSSHELQLMVDDVYFENKYTKSKKMTLNSEDIVKLYVNYRSRDPLTKDMIHKAFKTVMSSEEDSVQIPRSRFIKILESRGDLLKPDELSSIVKSLRDNKDRNYADKEHWGSIGDANEGVNAEVAGKENESDQLSNLLPEVITEDIFFKEILCIEASDEDLSAYVLKEEDFEFRPEPLKIEDFVLAVEKNNLWEELEIE